MKSVYISIIDFNGKENTIDCLKSLAKINKKGFELNIVLINNYPQKKLTIPDFPNLKIKIIESKKNLGFAGGHNVGVKYSLGKGADYVLILNNDTVIDKNLIVELVNTSDKGISVPKIYFAKGYEFHKGRYKESESGKVIWYAGGEMDYGNVLGFHRGVDEVDNGQYNEIMVTQFATGCCMMVTKQVFEKVGFFDERYFLYYEDSDFSQRARHKGFEITYNPNAVLWHKNAGSAGGSGSTLQDYYITRNRMLFGMKFAPLRSKLALIRESLKLLSSGRFWQRRGIIDFYLGNFAKGSFK